MINLFSDDVRRDPYPVYEQMRQVTPLLHVPPPFNGWMIFDYDGVKRALNDHGTFSSQIQFPRKWFLFSDPPSHTKLRALISRAFTPRSVVNLEPRIREISGRLLDAVIERGAMDLATDYAVPLPMMVIAEMIGVPAADWAQYQRWNEVLLQISHSRSGDEQASRVVADFLATSAEMNDYFAVLIAERETNPRDDLLTRLVAAEVDGERMTQDEILSFVQLLMVGGQETTTNLLNNAILCFLEHPDQLARLRAEPDLLPTAIEEVLRYRSPLQWMLRVPRRDVELNGQTIPAGALVLPMIGSANRDPKQFRDPGRFDITRDPNPHIAFGHGIHSCLGAPLSRLEAKIALGDLLERLPGLTLASDEPWPPRPALHVLGPARLPVRFDPGRRAPAPLSARD